MCSLAALSVPLPLPVPGPLPLPEILCLLRFRAVFAVSFSLLEPVQSLLQHDAHAIPGVSACRDTALATMPSAALYSSLCAAYCPEHHDAQ